jgi:peptidoglycan/LPS O-acetylase OafA/YrhL
MSDRRRPPVTPLAVGTLVLSVISAILVAGNVPNDPPFVIATVLLIGAAVLLLAAVALLARISEFAWESFFLVAGWSLVGYLVIAGMIEFAFIYDDTPGPQLAALSAGLALFAVDVPLLLGYSVARHQDVRG